MRIVSERSNLGWIIRVEDKSVDKSVEGDVGE